MVDHLKRSVENLEPPLCPHCHIEMKWHQSVLAEPQTGTVAHFFHCPNCSRITETKSVLRTSPSDEGPGYTIDDEGTFKTDSSGNLTGPYRYQAGDLVMARTNAANSASAQFFFVTGSAAANLDSQGTYVVFGHVTSGLDVLQKIASGPTVQRTDGLGESPSPAVTISKVTITSS